MLPAKSYFQLDRMRDDEEIWIVLASEPVSDLDAALDSGVLDTGRIKRILKIPGDCVRNVLTNTSLNLLVHHTATPAPKNAGAIAGLKQRRQFRFKCLVF